MTTYIITDEGKNLTICVLLVFGHNPRCAGKPTPPELTEEDVARIVAEELAKGDGHVSKSSRNCPPLSRVDTWLSAKKNLSLLQGYDTIFTYLLFRKDKISMVQVRLKFADGEEITFEARNPDDMGRRLTEVCTTKNERLWQELLEKLEGDKNQSESAS